jgi:hypothetical protein
MRKFRGKTKTGEGDGGAAGPARFHPDTGQRLRIRETLREGRVQAKPAISAPGEACEAEADRAAEAVMRMPPEDAVPALPERPKPQRACDYGGEEDQEVKAKAEGSGSGPAAAKAAERAVRAVRSGGEPLPAPERSFFERRFGRDFSSVRIHRDVFRNRAKSRIARRYGFAIHADRMRRPEAESIEPPEKSFVDGIKPID